MEREELRAIQAPLKERYESAPESAAITLRAAQPPQLSATLA